jgi:hypothetical protein
VQRHVDQTGVALLVELLEAPGDELEGVLGAALIADHDPLFEQRAAGLVRIVPPLMDADHQVEGGLGQVEAAAVGEQRGLHGEEAGGEELVLAPRQVALGGLSQSPLGGGQVVRHPVGVAELDPGAALEVGVILGGEVAQAHRFGQAAGALGEPHHLRGALVTEGPALLEQGLEQRHPLERLGHRGERLEAGVAADVPPARLAQLPRPGEHGGAGTADGGVIPLFFLGGELRGLRLDEAEQGPEVRGQGIFARAATVEDVEQDLTDAAGGHTVPGDAFQLFRSGVIVHARISSHDNTSEGNGFGVGGIPPPRSKKFTSLRQDRSSAPARVAGAAAMAWS